MGKCSNCGEESGGLYYCDACWSCTMTHSLDETLEGLSERQRSVESKQLIPLCRPIKDWTPKEAVAYLKYEIKNLKQLIKEKEKEIEKLGTL